MGNSTQSLFALALGPAWEQLHPAVRRHYDIHQGGEVLLHGRMSEIYHSLWVKPFILFGRVFGALVPYRGKDVPVEVHNSCEDDNIHLQFRRRFFFPGRKPYRFNSRMEHMSGNEIVEFVRFGLGIQMKLSVDGDALCYRTAGYLWRIGKRHISLPDWVFFGSGTIVERGVDQDRINLDFTLVHPLFGTSFRYAGIFSIVEDAQEGSQAPST